MGFIKKVYAHCDIPCGIYETDSMRHAAETCKKMVQKVEELGDAQDLVSRNNFVRYVHAKEEHADKCKNQLQILWSDYFKPEHLDRFPDLHTEFWMAIKQCSKVKHSMSVTEAEELIKQVANISQMFADSKS